METRTRAAPKPATKRVTKQGSQVILTLDYDEPGQAADDIQRIVDVALLTCISLDFDCTARSDTLASIERLYLALGGTPAQWSMHYEDARRTVECERKRQWEGAS